VQENTLLATIIHPDYFPIGVSIMASDKAQQQNNWMDLLTAVRPMVEKIPVVNESWKYFIGPHTFDDLS
jgi:hypothetical protein